MIASIRSFLVRLFWVCAAAGIILALVNPPLFERLVDRAATRVGHGLEFALIAFFNKVVIPVAPLLIVLYAIWIMIPKRAGGGSKS